MGSYLEARAHGGEWHLRIDDLDPPRVAPGATQAILRCLEALGFEWDGRVVYQSERQDAYHAALHRLRQLGYVYPCACTRKDITDTPSLASDNAIYPGTCRLSLRADRSARAWRFNVQGSTVEFYDGLLGPQRRHLERELGDFIVYRADGIYAFQLAAAVDDGMQGMTDVVRGVDLLESSARQIPLLRLLGLPIPRYIHLPVAVNDRGEKLSKQTGAAPVDLSRPIAALEAAWRFLNQAVTKDWSVPTVREFWRSAVECWDVGRVHACLEGRAPGHHRSP